MINTQFSLTTISALSQQNPRHLVSQHHHEFQTRDQFSLRFGTTYGISERKAWQHQRALKAHPQIVQIANSVLPLSKGLFNPPRTAFIIANPKNPAQLLLITATHGFSEQILTEILNGVFCHHKQDAFRDVHSEPYGIADLRVIQPKNSDWSILEGYDVLILEPADDFWVDTFKNTYQRKPLPLRDLNEEPLKEDEPIFFVGRSKNRGSTALGQCVETGKIKEIPIPCPDNLPGKQAEYCRATIYGPVRPGDSGSPVFDEDGRVIGMIVAGNEEGSGIFVTIKTILDTIEACEL